MNQTSVWLFFLEEIMTLPNILKANMLSLFLSSEELEEKEVQKAINNVNFSALLQAVHHYAETVYVFTADEQPTGGCNYRGEELFPCKATVLFSRTVFEAVATVETERTMELWLLENMELAAVSCMSFRTNKGTHITKYRSVRGTLPDEIVDEISINWSELLDNLYELSRDFMSTHMPIYEL